MTFADRSVAGRRLARRLTELRVHDPVVVAPPCGGVPVAWEVARELSAPLDVVATVRLRTSFPPHLSIGAMAEGGAWRPDPSRAGLANAGELEKARRAARAELADLAVRLRGGRPPIPLAGRTVILVDDWAMTGTTILAACEAVLAARPARLVVALPVAPVDVVGQLSDLADEVVCVLTPASAPTSEPCYHHLSKVSPGEAAALLTRSRERATGEHLRQIVHQPEHRARHTVDAAPPSSALKRVVGGRGIGARLRTGPPGPGASGPEAPTAGGVSLGGWTQW